VGTRVSPCQEVCEGAGLRCGHEDGGHGGDGAVVLHLRHQVGPRRELAALGVDVVVEDGPLARELDRGPRALPPLVRGLHSFTSQLNLSAFYGIGGARGGRVAHVNGVLGDV
jgi:hypothetical protein